MENSNAANAASHTTSTLLSCFGSRSAPSVVRTGLDSHGAGRFCEEIVKKSGGEQIPVEKKHPAPEQKVVFSHYSALPLERKDPLLVAGSYCPFLETDAAQ
jgi:hypothetical protein